MEAGQQPQRGRSPVELKGNFCLSVRSFVPPQGLTRASEGPLRPPRVHLQPPRAPLGPPRTPLELPRAQLGPPRAQLGPPRAQLRPLRAQLRPLRDPQVGITAPIQTFACSFCIIAPAQSHATDALAVYGLVFDIVNFLKVYGSISHPFLNSKCIYKQFIFIIIYDERSFK